MKEATIYDIANELEMSASTVSRDLADYPRISIRAKNRARVKPKELGYRQDKIGSSLTSGRGNTIGVLVPQIQRHFFTSIIHGMETELNARGYTITTKTAEETTKRLIDSNNPPYAFFASSDLAALAVLQYVTSGDYKIPKEVGVAGFGNEPFTEMITPSLNTLEQFGAEMGSVSSKIPLNTINNEQETITASMPIKPRLIVRESTRRKGISE